MPVRGIFKMHVMFSDGKVSHLWRNSAFHRSSGSLVIVPSGHNLEIEGTLSNAHQYDNDSTDTLTYHDVVKVAKGNFIGYYATVFETGDLKGFAEDDETEINYLKKSFLK